MIIDGKHIKSENGKGLLCLWDGKLYGDEVWLGKVFYKDGVRLDEPYELVVDDFTEVDVDSLEVIDGKAYDFTDKSYAEIKMFIIKLHYSNDDQIAIMLNNDEERMEKMQNWREYASEIARKYNQK